MMSLDRMLLGALPDSALLPQGLPAEAQGSLRGLMPVLVAVFAVLALSVIWAVFLRKPPGARRRGVLVEGEVSDRSTGLGRRRRRRRRERRPTNPTRAETGGLPPAGAGGVDSTIL